MRIGIIGGGSIGLLLAGRLGRGHKVTVFTRTESQADAINCAGGINIKGIHPVFTECKAETLSPSSTVGDQELLIVTVKQGAIEAVLPSIHHLKSPIVFLQNGMSHLKKLDSLHSASVYVGITEHGALRNHETETIHTGLGSVRIGLYKGERRDDIFDAIHHEFPIEIVSDIYPRLIEKLVVNACINPLTAVLGVKNGELITNSYFRRLLCEICKEVCRGLGIEEGEHRDYQEKVLLICERTADNKSSMLRDMELQRKTEIESILGFCLEEAEKRKEKVGMVSSLYMMVKGLEESGGK
ncbi:hypothetical protein AC622_13375 [Bacillus sp. FJAT-27916]|uniref:2-dehydropantoate 2-reductase n=1 Tax=Bacillaceae TaxID=186817 RepID=UPI000670AF1C|nr:2-dehydropantoate 2-reductase [Bacillus sp. FJAT-27916]KMY45097.1 hypothetical protein AC622_13375 [Bacillus sp. FJAT-27916]